jgi:hypothetical protein
VSTSEVDPALVGMVSFGLLREAVLVDLAQAESFDVIALQQLLSAMAARRRSGHGTRLRLPVAAAARHQLRLWRFPDAVSAVTRTPFHHVVLAEDHAYFGEEWPADPADEGSHSPRASVHAYLSAQHCFGLRPYLLTDAGTRQRMLPDEVSRWGGHALTRLLESVLAGPAADVLRVLVQELVSGVLQRSHAGVAVVGAQLELPGTPDGTGLLTISEWDDGDLQPYWLRKVIGTGPLGRDVFRVHRGGRDVETYDARRKPLSDTDDAELVLASLVTSSPYDLDPSGGGRGSHRMYSLYKSVVDTFQGVLRIDSGRHRLEVSADPRGGPSSYRVDLRSGPELPDQQGCLLSARLPVRDV